MTDYKELVVALRNLAHHVYCDMKCPDQEHYPDCAFSIAYNILKADDDAQTKE